jgi:LacI family transcriptional regulator
MARKKSLNRTDIAEAAGVSPSTVSRALAGSSLLPASTITRIRRIASDLGYRPNVLARRLATNRSLQIGFVVPLGVSRRGAFQTSYFSHILDAVVAAADGFGYGVTIYPYDRQDRSRARKLAELVESHNVDGLIFAGLSRQSRVPGLLLKRKIPFLLIGSRAEGVPSVNCNPEPGIREMLSTLAKKGYRRLFFAEGDQAFHDAVRQKEALLSAITGTSLEIGGIFNGDYSRRSGYEAAEWALRKHARIRDCIFLANDRMAVGFYRRCQECLVPIPEYIGIIGSDDDEVASGLFPELTTIRQPRAAMGAAAVEKLIGLISGNADSGSKTDLEYGETFVPRGSI